MKSLFNHQALAVLLLLALPVFGSGLPAKNTDSAVAEVKKLIKGADLKFDKDLYMEAHAYCERIHAGDPENNDAVYYLAYAKYRLLLLGMSSNDKSAFGNYYSSAITLTKNLSGDKVYRSEALTLLAAIYMMKLATDHSQGPALTPKIHELLGKAAKENPKNPRTHIVRGHMLKNTPEFYGGSLKGALKQFEYAVSIFEEESSASGNLPDWGHLEALVEMGNIYSSLKDYKAARKAYEKALLVEPDYGYVKYKLLPELEDKFLSAY